MWGGGSWMWLLRAIIGAMADWRVSLRHYRERLGLDRKTLASLAGVSAETIKSYEHGRRAPSRLHLMAVLDAMKVDRGERGEVLIAAGFASDSIALRSALATLGTREAIVAHVERYRWPSFITNDAMEVVGANAAAQRLWGVDMRYEFTDSIDRNLMSLMSNPRFADRCVNWDAIITEMISIFKGHHQGPEILERPSPYFAAVLARFLKGDPGYVERFFQLWESVVPATGRFRWSYDVEWSEPGAGDLRFCCFVSAADMELALSFNDWIPIDAETWVALERIVR